MRLFAAIVPPDDVLDDLDSELSRLGLHETDEYSGLRWTPRERRHLTVAFYGRDDPYSRAELLAERLSGQQGPRLSIEGAGTFSGVLWAGVAGDLGALAAAVGAADADRPYRPHVTLARWRHPGVHRAARRWARALAEYRGPGWQAREVVLMRSEPGAGGPRYTVRARFALLG